MTASVGAVVVNYNTRDHLVECVRSLRADGVTEVVVVDNASADGSGRALEQSDADAVLLTMSSNLGYGTAANRGVAVTDADYVMVLNPDTVVEPGTTKVLAEALDRDPGLAVVGPRMENDDGSLYPSARCFPNLVDAAGHAFLGFVAPANPYTRRYRMLDWDHSGAGDVDWVSGACMLVRRTAFASAGGFDEAYFMYAEDVDLCWRLRQAGWRIGYEPGGRVVHSLGASSRQRPYRMILAHHRSLLRFASKTTTGRNRLLLPVVGAGLAVRTVVAWADHALDRGRPVAQ
ncbi:MAG: glycosyltransferase family 2 protein [Actinomycetota bacterium]|nr:glycosyltransferase family 2 protein [Actinomycetota bacterium]